MKTANQRVAVAEKLCRRNCEAVSHALPQRSVVQGDTTRTIAPGGQRRCALQWAGAFDPALCQRRNKIEVTDQLSRISNAAASQTSEIGTASVKTACKLARPQGTWVADGT
jgi:hypothetical protein